MADRYELIKAKEIASQSKSVTDANCSYHGANEIFAIISTYKTKDFENGLQALLCRCCIWFFLRRLQIEFSSHTWLFLFNVNLTAANAELTTANDVRNAQKNLYSIVHKTTDGEANGIVSAYDTNRGMEAVRALDAQEVNRSGEARAQIKKQLNYVVEKGFPADFPPKATLNQLYFYINVYNRVAVDGTIDENQHRHYIYEIAMNCPKLEIYSSLKVLKQNDSAAFNALSVQALTNSVISYFVDHMNSVSKTSHKSSVRSYNTAESSNPGT